MEGGGSALQPQSREETVLAVENVEVIVKREGELMDGEGELQLRPAPATARSRGKRTDALCEARRRRATSALYDELAALLPGLPARATKTSIVEAAVAQVKVLQDTAGVLEAYRAVQETGGGGHGWDGDGGGGGGGAQVSTRDAVCFAVRLPAARPRGAVTRVLQVFDRRGVEVLAATVARGGGAEGGEAATVVTITAAAAEPEVMEMIKTDIAGIIV